MVHKSLVYTFDFEKLKRERARQGKSIRQLAEMACLDIKTIVRIEKGSVDPRWQTMGKIAKALEKDIEEFMCPSPVKNNPGAEVYFMEQKEGEDDGK